MNMPVHSTYSGLEIREKISADKKEPSDFFVYAVGGTTCLKGPTSLAGALGWIKTELLAIAGLTELAERAELARAVTASLPPLPPPPASKP